MTKTMVIRKHYVNKYTSKSSGGDSRVVIVTKLAICD